MTTTQARPNDAVMAPKVADQRRRAASRAKDLAALMKRRPDLHGVYKPADVAAEAVLWSA
jgi:hypothetical protein